VKKSTKEKIMDAALTVFAEKGFQEATVSDISKVAETSDATLYEYFASKEALLFAISKVRTEKFISLINDTLPFIRGPENKLWAFVQANLTRYQADPLYTAVGLLELKTNRRYHKSEEYQTIRKVARLLLDIIKEGIQSGVFRKDLNPFVMRSMILGTIEHICIRRHLLDVPTNLTDYIEPIVNLILDGARPRANLRKFRIDLQISEGKIECQEVTDVEGE
jgi:TetR/AcrR family transcriptional regulator, fatty acid metabolism regulator protein